jgi:hypothetical protein
MSSIDDLKRGLAKLLGEDVRCVGLELTGNDDGSPTYDLDVLGWTSARTILEVRQHHRAVLDLCEQHDCAHIYMPPERECDSEDKHICPDCKRDDRRRVDYDRRTHVEVRWICMNEQCTARPTHARIEKAAPVKVPPRCYTGPSNEYVALARHARQSKPPKSTPETVKRIVAGVVQDLAEDDPPAPEYTASLGTTRTIKLPAPPVPQLPTVNFAGKAAPAFTTRDLQDAVRELQDPDPYLPPDADGIRWAREMPKPPEQQWSAVAHERGLWRGSWTQAMQSVAEMTGDEAGSVRDKSPRGFQHTYQEYCDLIRSALPRIRANTADKPKPSADPWGTYGGELGDGLEVVHRHNGAHGTLLHRTDSRSLPPNTAWVVRATDGAAKGHVTHAYHCGEAGWREVLTDDWRPLKPARVEPWQRWVCGDGQHDSVVVDSCDGSTVQFDVGTRSDVKAMLTNDNWTWIPPGDTP